jgi:uroporphyrinogen decarboxylase
MADTSYECISPIGPDGLTNRQVWRRIMNYEEVHRMPFMHWKGWPETYERWYDEGLPEDLDEHEFFGTAPMWMGVGPHVGLYPAFEEKVLEETDEYRIIRENDGVVKKDWKTRSCIPHFVDFTLKTAEDWPKYKERLQPDPGRIPEDFQERIDRAEASGCPVNIGCTSMMGWIRNWMGVQNMSYLMYDAPEVYADMVQTLADLSCWAIEQTMPRMQEPPDLAWSWEDICGKAGPLVGPDLFDRLVAPGYRQVRETLEEHGVHLYGIDSDGQVEPLVGNWLRAGVNIQFPVEPGTWGATPEHLREKFGRDLRIHGGFDKLVLEKDKEAIDAEIESHVGLMKEGGFAMMPDHLITPDTPLENYVYYLERVRELRF